jgi:hypothetical protein
MVVPDINSISVSIDISGFPLQFLLMKQNILCPIRFHFDVPGGKWEICVSNPVIFANSCGCFFQGLTLDPLLPPLSLLIYIFDARG